MFNWLRKRGEDARIYMCMGDLITAIERTDHFGRAMILANAHYHRAATFHRIGISNVVFDKPKRFNREDLFYVYRVLEDARNNLIRTMEEGVKFIAIADRDLARDFEWHIQTFARGIELWMCASATGIKPKETVRVRGLWQYLEEARSSVPSAIDTLLAIDHRLGAMVGEPPNMFTAMAREEWLNETKFVPSLSA